MPSGATRRERPARRSGTRSAVGSASRDSRSPARIKRRWRTRIGRPSGSPSSHRTTAEPKRDWDPRWCGCPATATGGRSSTSWATDGPNGSTSCATGSGGDARPDRHRPGHGPGRDGCGAVDRSVDSGGPDVPAVPTPVPGGPDISGPPAAAGAGRSDPCDQPRPGGRRRPDRRRQRRDRGLGRMGIPPEGRLDVPRVRRRRQRRCGVRSRGVHAQADDVDLGAGWLRLRWHHGKPTAVGAVIRFADGTATKAPLIVPGDLSTIGGRYYVAAIPPTVQTVTVDIVDAGGTVLETATLNVR